MNWIQLLSQNRPGETTKKAFPRQIRTAFEQDYDRIIFSSPFRMLQDKTQVFPLPKHDFVHSRLTHSLEVSSVGRSIGKSVGEKIISRNQELKDRNYSANDFGSIVAAACLTHDLGNPPFGHSGEDAISEFFSLHPQGVFFEDMVSEKEWIDLVHFEGNAQGFRLLNKKQYQGLKLSCATLAAFTKYPRPSFFKKVDKQRRSQKKFGFYQTESIIFQEVADQTGLIALYPEENVWCRHPLAFLVEAADDICYHIIDLEDGCNAGLIPYSEVETLLAGILEDRFKPEKLQKIDSTREKVGLLRALSIGVLIEQCTDIFLANEEAILAGNFDQSLVDLIPTKSVLKKIIEVSVNKVYRSQEVMNIEIAGFDVMNGLLEYFSQAVYEAYEKRNISHRNQALLRMLPSEYQNEIAEEGASMYQLLRSLLDFISGMTDTYAINLYRKIKGIDTSGF